MIAGAQKPLRGCSIKPWQRGRSAGGEAQQSDSTLVAVAKKLQ